MNVKNEPSTQRNATTSHVEHCAENVQSFFSQAAATANQGDNARHPTDSSMQHHHYEYPMDSSCITAVSDEGSKAACNMDAFNAETKSIACEGVNKGFNEEATSNQMLRCAVSNQNQDQGTADTTVPNLRSLVDEHQTNAKNDASMGRWTADEHTRFLAAVLQHGKNWKHISAALRTRTAVQVRTHAQKYLLKLTKARQNRENTSHQSQDADTEAPAIPATNDGTDSRSLVDKRRTNVANDRINNGHWAEDEHHLFVVGLLRHGENWKEIAAFVETRTALQARTHAQKFYKKLAKARQNGENVAGMVGVKITFDRSSASGSVSVATSEVDTTNAGSLHNQQEATNAMTQPHQGSMSKPSTDGNSGYTDFYRPNPSMFSEAYEEAYAKGFSLGTAKANLTNAPPFEQPNCFASFPPSGQYANEANHAIDPLCLEPLPVMYFAEEMARAAKGLKIEEESK